MIGGGLVVPKDKEAEFNNELEELLTYKLKVRSIAEFQKGAIEILRGLLFPTEVTEGTCSKHWWHNYRISFPKIEELWKKLPLQKTVDSREKPKNSRRKSRGRGSVDGIEVESIDESRSYQSTIGGSNTVVVGHGVVDYDQTNFDGDQRPDYNQEQIRPIEIFDLDDTSKEDSNQTQLTYTPSKNLAFTQDGNEK